MEPSAIGHPLSAISNPPSAIRYPPTSIRPVKNPELLCFLISGVHPNFRIETKRKDWIIG